MESNVSSHLYLPPSFSYFHKNHPLNHQSFPFSVFHENASPPSSPQLHPSTTHHLSKHDPSNPSSFSKYSQPSNAFLLLLLTPLHLLCDPSSLLFLSFSKSTFQMNSIYRSPPFSVSTSPPHTKPQAKQLFSLFSFSSPYSFF